MKVEITEAAPYCPMPLCACLLGLVCLVWFLMVTIEMKAASH